MSQSEHRFRDLLDVFPAAVYTTDAEGRLTFFNRAAEEIAGRTPVLGQDRWCVSWRIWDAAGNPLPMDDWPIVRTIRDGVPVRGVEIQVERPDGSRIPLMPFPTPLYDAAGNLIGAINMMIDLSALKGAQATTALRVDEQAALYSFTDKLFRAETLSDCYDAAIKAIIASLHCHRAAVLLFDAAGVMQFAASTGLSPGYKRAVTGHSPWKKGESDPKPVVIADVAASDLSDELKDAVRSEGIGALAFVPVMANGSLIGKFMAYYDRPHAFSEAELDLALTLARQLGFAVERERARVYRIEAERLRLRGEERQRESDAEFRALADNIHQLAWMTDSAGSIYWYNQRWFEYTGTTLEEMRGWGWRKVQHPQHLDRVEAKYRRHIASGEPWEDTFPLRGRDGKYRWFLSRALPIRDDKGKVVRWFGTNTDITERLQAEEQRTLLINELNHRVKNTLATVQSMAMQTLRSTERSEDARALFESRLAALSRAHDLLTRQNWSGANLQEVVERALAPFVGDDARISIDGPATLLTTKQALSLSIVLHELATNAAKHGALSTESGKVSVVWSVTEGAHGKFLQFTWTETGGPLVARPTRSGFGTRLIERNLASELGGTAMIEFRPEGVVTTINNPLDAVDTAS